MYDVVIVGGSFAGLSVAMQLRGRQVLIVDQHPIGSRQMSSCGTPLPIARAVGAEAAILEEHPALVVHAHSTGGLTASLWAHRARATGTLHALVLDSPWLDLAGGWFRRLAGPRLVDAVAVFRLAHEPLGRLAPARR